MFWGVVDFLPWNLTLMMLTMGEWAALVNYAVALAERCVGVDV